MSRRCIFVHRSLKKQTWRALWKSSTAVFGSNELIGIPMSLSIGSFENYSNFLCSGLRCVHIFWPPRILKLQLLGRFLKREACNNTFRCIFFWQFFLWAQTLIYDISKAAIKIRISMFINSQNISLRFFRWNYWRFKFRLLRQFKKVRWLTLGPCYAPQMKNYTYLELRCIDTTEVILSDTSVGLCKNLKHCATDLRLELYINAH